jgi:hypothetical protein
VSETQKQAIQRFFGFLIAEVITLVIGILASPELGQVVIDLAGEGSLVATLILALLPPLIGALGKLQAGPTEKVANVRGRAADGRFNRPGLFG